MDRCELIRFWGQKVKSQGHDWTKYGCKGGGKHSNGYSLDSILLKLIFVVDDYFHLLPLPRSYCTSLCFDVCLSVSRITQKSSQAVSSNPVGSWAAAVLRTLTVLGLIQYFGDIYLDPKVSLELFLKTFWTFFTGGIRNDSTQP